MGNKVEFETSEYVFNADDVISSTVLPGAFPSLMFSYVKLHI